MSNLKQINFYIRLSSLIGLLLSFYALYVEVKKEENENYTAYCDINEHVSCTKAFSSKYGKGFGLIGAIVGENSILNQPNSVAGILFYSLLIAFSFINQRGVVKIQTILCIVSNFMSVYLAYILYYILHDFCIVCVSTYVINAINLMLTLSKHRALKEGDKRRNIKKKSN